MRMLLVSALLFAAVEARAEPREMTAIRERFERLEEPVRREMAARLMPLRQAYANELDICAERFELEGRREDAEAARRERDRVRQEAGLKAEGKSPAARPAAAPVKKLPVVVGRNMTREELLAAAKKKLNERQYAVAERLTFKDFGWDCERGEGFCLVACVGAREDGVFRHGDLTAEVRYLMEAGKEPLVFDSVAEALSPVERVRGMTVMPGGTWYEFDRRGLTNPPLAARVRVFYFGTTVFEAEWVRSGESSRYNQEGKVPWWQERDYGGMVNLNTATAAELAGVLRIKAASASDILRKRPFLAKEEVASRVTGIGKKTYELIEAKICVR